MRSRPLGSSPNRARSDRHRNQPAVIGEYMLQRLLDRNDDLAADLSQRLDAFRPLPFNAAVEAQGILSAHWVNLTHVF